MGAARSAWAALCFVAECSTVLGVIRWMGADRFGVSIADVWPISDFLEGRSMSTHSLGNNGDVLRFTLSGELPRNECKYG